MADEFSFFQVYTQPKDKYCGVSISKNAASLFTVILFVGILLDFTFTPLRTTDYG